MAQNSYIGIAGKARLLKGINIGVAGKARKVIGGFIGVAGKARQFFSLAKGVKFYQTVDPLNASVTLSAAACIGDYGLFAGGTHVAYKEVTQVTSYNGSLQKGTPSALTQKRSYHAGQGNSGYAIFAGGGMDVSGSWSIINGVEGYSASLQKTSVTLTNARYNMAAARTGNNVYALFAGGYGQIGLVTEVDAFNASMQRSNPAALPTAVSFLAGGNVGVYAIFAGGQTGTGVSTQVTAYNNTLQKSTPTALSVGRSSLAAADIINSTDGKRYTLFAGGYTGSMSSAIEAYNDSLQRTILPDGLGVATSELAGTSCRAYEGETVVYQAVFAGGYSNVVTIINSSLQRLTPSAISSANRQCLAATFVPYSTRQYALFGGGNNDGGIVDAFTYF